MNACAPPQALLGYHNQAWIRDIIGRYAIDETEARRLCEQALYLLWLLGREPAPLEDGLQTGLAGLLARPLGVIQMVAERLLIRTRDYADLCQQLFDRTIDWPVFDARVDEHALARAMAWLFDGLGERRFSLWFDQLADRYRPQQLDALRLLPSHKTFNRIAPGDAEQGDLATDLRVELRCAVTGAQLPAPRLTVEWCWPRIWVIRGVAGELEREHLITAAREHMQPSRVRGAEQDRARSSTSYKLPADDRVVAQLQRRIAQIVGLPVDRAEPLSVHRYGIGEAFQPHYDNPTRELAVAQGLARLRLLSCLLYLNEVEAGGYTWFPYLGLSLRPEPGSLLVFHNFTLDGSEAPNNKHAGRRVTAGEKWIATQWFWSRATKPSPVG